MKTLKEMEEYASLNYIPIARKDFVNFLIKLMKDNNYTSLLEIGSAIGYSAINLALNNIDVTTIEHNEIRYKECVENIKDFELDNKIKTIYGDALEININEKFDIVFIDAAKAKSIRFFEHFKDNLNDNGLIIIDNMKMDDFNKMAKQKKIDFYKKVIEDLKYYLNNLKDYTVTYDDVGDGIAILKKNSIY